MSYRNPPKSEKEVNGTPAVQGKSASKTTRCSVGEVGCSVGDMVSVVGE